MEKRLSQRMAENAVTENRSNAKLNLASFLLIRDEIYEAINDGWSVRYTWEVLYKEKKITFGYQTFLNYINKYKNNPSIKERKSVDEKKSNKLPEPRKEPETVSEEILESESSEDRIKISNIPDDPKKDYGNPEGFKWDTDFDPKDFV